ncbi:MAG: DNA repair protein RadC [Peptococcaceae bacterium]|jgi:DNA repair protein RadC|nr:DNA repair protein RadC [Peptococcaceae bacterium]
MGLKDMPPHQRPRERLLAFGAARLTDQELLAILIGSGSREESALALAQRLLQAEGGQFILEADALEISGIKGIGAAKACRIKACVELMRRLFYTSPATRPVISGPKDAADLVQGEIGYLDREGVRVINLNTANQVIAIDSVSLGGLNAAPAHPREVFKQPIRRSAAGIILLHNHPSGDLRPSRRDVEETRRLAAAGELLGIQLYDHIILGYGKFHSMLESGRMADIRRQSRPYDAMAAEPDAKGELAAQKGQGR